MDWFQKIITISESKRGFVLITDQIMSEIPEINEFKIGILHLFIKHIIILI